MDVDRKTPSGQGNTYFTPPRGHLPLRWAGSMISTMSFTSTFWFCWSIRVTLRSSETDKNLSSFVGLRFLWFSKMGRSQPIAALNLFNVDTFSANRMIGVQDWSAQLLPSGRERFRDRQRLFRYFFGCWPSFSWHHKKCRASEPSVFQSQRWCRNSSWCVVCRIELTRNMSPFFLPQIDRRSWWCDELQMHDIGMMWSESTEGLMSANQPNKSSEYSQDSFRDGRRWRDRQEDIYIGRWRAANTAPCNLNRGIKSCFNGATFDFPSKRETLMSPFE